MQRRSNADGVAPRAVRSESRRNLLETVMRQVSLLGTIVACLALSGVVRTQPSKPLDIYFIDVEGGQSTLFVSPSGESMLVDTGSPGERDAERIVATAKSAGLKQIDYVV